MICSTSNTGSNISSITAKGGDGESSGGAGIVIKLTTYVYTSTLHDINITATGAKNASSLVIDNSVATKILTVGSGADLEAIAGNGTDFTPGIALSDASDSNSTLTVETGGKINAIGALAQGGAGIQSGVNGAIVNNNGGWLTASGNNAPGIDLSQAVLVTGSRTSALNLNNNSFTSIQSIGDNDVPALKLGDNNIQFTVENAYLNLCTGNNGIGNQAITYSETGNPIQTTDNAVIFAAPAKINNEGFQLPFYNDYINLLFTLDSQLIIISLCLNGAN